MIYLGGGEMEPYKSQRTCEENEKTMSRRVERDTVCHWKWTWVVPVIAGLSVLGFASPVHADDDERIQALW